MTCEWPVDRSAYPALPDEDDPEYPAAIALQTDAENVAITVLWSLSGRQFGVCPVRVRPCEVDTFLARRLDGYGGMWRTRSFGWDLWENWGCGCFGGCEVRGPRKVHLPGPAQAVTEVVVGVDVLPETGYTLEGDVLYRIGSTWPRQDLGKPLGEPGTWSVTYLRGVPVPLGVDRLTGLLALELIRAATGDGKCRLPKSVTRLARQGVSYELDPVPLYAAGKTGVPEIDTWLAAVNPYHIMQAPSVL